MTKRYWRMLLGAAAIVAVAVAAVACGDDDDSGSGGGGSAATATAPGGSQGSAGPSGTITIGATQFET
jgi:hypothetical protein